MKVLQLINEMTKSKGGLEITEENLEDLLAYDDLFLDFFNCFLSLPVFPQALFYNRLTGAFDELDDVRLELTNSLSSISPSRQYGPTDQERDKMLEWAREERLPLFLRTQLFRELKLVKLLLRPLDNDRQTASRDSSRNIRGYSRASESYISSLSISGEKSTNNNLDDLDFQWDEPDYPVLFPYQRPGSRAFSLPAMLLLDAGKYAPRPSLTSTKKKSSDPVSGKPMSSASTHSYETNSEFQLQLAELSQSFTGRTNSISEKHILPMNSNPWSEHKQRLRNMNRTEEDEVFAADVTSSKTARMSSGFKKSKSSQSKAPASSTEEAFLRGARALSAPVSFEDYFRMPDEGLQHFEEFFGEMEPDNDGHSYVQFEEEGVTEEQTEIDMRSMEGRLKMSVQQMKEHILGSHSAFDEFRQFLQGTSGEHLLSFWLECENFKDVMEDFDDVQNMKALSKHFKNIQDKFKLKLTQDALDQITKAATNMGVSHNIFLRTQYDVLRRLRAYWLPRFLIHCEMTGAVSLSVNENMDSSGMSNQPYRFIAQEPQSFKSKRLPQTPLFPSISLVHSMPVLPEDAKDFATKQTMNVSYDSSSSSLRRMFPRQRSNLSAKSRRSGSSLRKSTKERFVIALSADRHAGGPFYKYLSKLEDLSLLDSLMFWEDVTEFGSTEDKSFDRLLRLCQAWNIYHKYLSEDSPHRIDLPEKEIVHLHQSLEKAREYMEISLFDNAKILAAEKLEKAWIRYLKEDLKKFLDCKLKTGTDSPPSTAEAIEITVTEYDIVIKRPRPWVRRIPGSTASERARRLNKALMMAEDEDEDKKAKKRAEAREKRKEMERARRKAIRAAYARLKANKEQSQTDSSHQQLLPNETVLDASKIENVPSINEVLENKPVMNLFKKYVSDDDKETNNLMQLYYDLETYFSITSSKSRKEAQALHIVKLYLEPESKRCVSLDNEQLLARITEEADRPSTAVLKDVQSLITPKVEEIFKEFMLKQSEELGVDPKALAAISQAELTLRLSTEQAMIASWDKKKLKGKATGRAPPTREHKNEFLTTLNQSAMGHLSIPMLYFYKYLLKHGPEDDMPHIDKDLFFYIEVQKFKDCSHNYSDEELLRGKVQSIVDCFLESCYSPSLQIDIPMDLHQKALKAAQRYVGSKEITSTLFDEAQIHIFKELLLYWAGFRRAASRLADLAKRPVLKYEKMLRRRLENIQNYQAPSSEFTLPSIPEGAIPSFSISLSEGIRFKAQDESTAGTPLPDGQHRDHKGSRAGMVLADGPIVRSRASSRKNSLVAR